MSGRVEVQGVLTVREVLMVLVPDVRAVLMVPEAGTFGAPRLSAGERSAI